MTTTRVGLHGVPGRISLTVRDLRAVQDFYAVVLGWEYEPRPGNGVAQCSALADGMVVGALGAVSGSAGVPGAWTPHFLVDSADRIAGRVRDRGATVAVGPLRVGEGRAVWAADPAGAVFGLWEGPGDPVWRGGCGPGAPAWLELRTDDPFASAMFYGNVFEWDAPDHEYVDIGFEHDRVVVRVEGRTVARMYGGGLEEAPDPILRPSWQVHFRVRDVDASARVATAAGGSVTLGPHDTPFGRGATLRDPEGALFHLVAG
ncbi:VOC family protein [Streptomyces sp. ST2-7A]|uniref:VOC family protein n=1 Tax=Streptomyces sp. ST2-7A TaxID=2907214 RepID=UPI001F1F3496|nr:VOC family protein [Streptomyces sp. ST2-7A]MCE7083427.1 VOC family protein [Streptomyces sp. ST2-7A]